MMVDKGVNTMSTSPPTRQKSPSILFRIIGGVFFYTFAVSNWLLYLFLALRSGTFFKSPTEKEQLQFAIRPSQNTVQLTF